MKYAAESEGTTLQDKYTTTIAGKAYRTGFLHAEHALLDPEIYPHLRMKRENIFVLPTEFYHYTSIAGLKGIVEENGVWASDNRFMNDTEENRHGVRLAREALKHRAERSDDAAFAKILLDVEELIAKPKNQGYLVACFSMAKDDLGQWRGYGTGGVALRFGNPIKHEAPLLFGPDHLAFGVIYRDRQKYVMLFSIIRAFERQYAVDRKEMTEWPDDHDENYTNAIHAKISFHILGFKDRAFQKESEIRLVLEYDEIDKYHGGLNFRAGPLGIVPYLRTGGNRGTRKNGGRLPLREVMVGPSPHQEIIAQSVETFLEHKGYIDTTVSCSAVPYRG
ncbi:MAG: hypothetical protein CL949_07575 [Erythrobacter sp.]|nr:hypothetical protein [Erythrobacter sp.]